MKHNDKLAEYIRKEVDSIPYEGEDQMWAEFQKTNSGQLAKWNKSNYFFPFLLAVLMLTLSSVIYFQYNKTSGLTTDNNTQSFKAFETSTNNSLHGTSTHSGATKEMNSSNNETSIVATTEQEETSTLQKNDFSLNQNSSSPIFETQIKSKTKSKNPIFRKTSTQGSDFYNNTNTSTTLNLDNELFYSSAPSSPLVSKKNSEENKGIIIDKLEIKDELGLNSKSPLIASLFNYVPDIDLENFGEKLDQLNTYPSYGRRNPFYLRAMFTASTNNIYKTSFDFGKTKKLTETTGLKYGIGFSVEDGLSVSQDSFIHVNGIFIQEITKNKDLDYLLNTFITAEYFVQKNNLSASFGGQLSYATFNKMITYDQTRTFYTTGVSTSGSNGFKRNLWTNGINRLGIHAMINLSYKVNNYEISFLTSKRFNKLIKKDNAQKSKSNIPFQFGTSITRYF